MTSTDLQQGHGMTSTDLLWGEASHLAALPGWPAYNGVWAWWYRPATTSPLVLHLPFGLLVQVQVAGPPAPCPLSLLQLTTAPPVPASPLPFCSLAQVHLVHTCIHACIDGFVGMMGILVHA